MSQLKTNNSKLSKVNLSDLTIIQQLPENQRKAILELIDTKTNNDMKEVIRAVEALGIRFDELKMSTALQLSQMKDSIDLRFSQMQASTDASLSQIKHSYLILGTWYSRQWGSSGNYHLFSNAQIIKPTTDV